MRVEIGAIQLPRLDYFCCELNQVMMTVMKMRWESFSTQQSRSVCHCPAKKKPPQHLPEPQQTQQSKKRSEFNLTSNFNNQESWRRRSLPSFWLSMWPRPRHSEPISALHLEDTVKPNQKTSETCNCQDKKRLRFGCMALKHPRVSMERGTVNKGLSMFFWDL